MNEAEIDAQWKLEKQKRYQNLLDYLKSTHHEQTRQTAQNREQPVQEQKDVERQPLAAERSARRHSR